MGGRKKKNSLFEALGNSFERLYRRFTTVIFRYRHLNWAMADQGMVSGLNFLVGLVLARYLGLAEFGRYTLAWMAVEFLLTVQHCLIIAPMMSIGPQTPVEKQRVYMGSIFAQQGLFAIVSICVFFGILKTICFVKPDWEFDGMIPPIVFAGLAAQMQNFSRRYQFTCNRGEFAFLVDIVRYFGQFIVLLPFLLMLNLDAASALWIAGITSALSAVLGFMLREPLEWDVPFFRQMVQRHLHFAKWLLLSEILRWCTINMFMAVAGTVLGMASVGAIRTAQLLLGICNILILGVENFAVVRASQHYRERGMAALVDYVKRITIMGGLATAGIALVVAVVPEFWLGLIKKEYQGFGDLVRWWAVVHFLMFVTSPLIFALRTIEQTRAIFWAYLSSGIISIITVYPVIKIFGLTGVMAGIVLITLLRTLTLFYAFYRLVIMNMSVLSQNLRG